MNFFGRSTPKVDPAAEALELAKTWKRNLAKEMRNIEKDIKTLQTAEQKSVKECKKLQKEGHSSSIRILAREIVNTRKAIERMYTAKAQLNSVSMQLQTTAGNNKSSTF